MKAAFYTLGCKTNQFETQGMERLFREKGHEIVDFSEYADVYVVNTCTVTAFADKKSRNAARKAKLINPDCTLIVCGCYSQLDPDAAKQTTHADIVIGSDNKSSVLELAESAYYGRPARPAPSCGGFDVLPPGGLAERTRALLKIQDGCRNFCTYCRIPYARGEYRSLPLDEMKRQCLMLADEGYREIVVTGIEISSYGAELENVSLSDALRVILSSCPGIRIRLGSLEPRTVNGAFIETISGFDNLCPHFHLSLQSGCDKILKAMNRKYDTETYLSSVERLRKAFPGCAVTTDLIVGFPGETEQDFLTTLDFIQKCGFSQMHIFPFSRRPGTAAYRMDGQIPNAEKHRRAAEAKKVSDRMSRAFLDEKIGTKAEVLFENRECGYIYGHTKDYCRAAVGENEAENNELGLVVFESVRGGVLYGHKEKR